MILICAACAVVAALLGVGPPASRGLRDRLSPAPPRAHRSTPGRARTVVAVAGLTGAAAACTLGLGGRAGAVAWAGALVTGTLLRLLQQRGRIRRALQARREVARACGLLASQLRVGQVSSEALRLAAEECPVLSAGHRTQLMGGDAATVWREQSEQPGQAGLAELARAWRVSARTGAPLAPVLEQVAANLVADQSLREVVAGELAAPRATGKLMAALPFCGIGLGYLLGGDPLSWLLAGWAGWLCLVAGVALACAGVLWIELLARQAAVRA